MLRTERVAVAIAAMIAWVVAFVAFSSYEQLVPAGSRTAFNVEGVSDISNAEAAAVIQDLAEQCGCAILRVSADPENPDGRVMYLFDGRGDGALSYADFTRGRTTKVLTGGELGMTDARGLYAADSEIGSEALGGMVERGVIAAPAFWDTSLFVALTHVDVTTWAVAVALALGLAAAIVLGTVQRRRRDAIWVVQGRSAASRYLRDAGEFVLTTVAAGAAVCVAGWVFLGWYNGWNQLGTFALWAGAAMVALVVIVVAEHGLARVSCPRLRVVDLLKGERPASYSFAMAVGLQALVVAVAAVGLNLAIAGLREARDMRQFESEWRAASDLVFIYAADAEPLLASSDFGEDTAFLLEQDAAGKAILVYQGEDYWGWANGYVGGDFDVQVGFGSTMLVNPNYLAREPVLDQSGVEIDPTAIESFTVLVPEHLAAYAPVYEAAGLEFAEGEASDLQGRTTAPGITLKPEVRLIQSGQTLFTFATPSYYRPAAWIDPVLYGVPLELGVVSSASLRYYMFTGDVLFSDSTAASRALDQGMNSDSQPELFRLTTLALDSIATARSAAWRAIAALALALGVLVLAAVVFAASDCLRHRRELFARLIHGRRLAPMAVPTAVLAAGAGVAGLGLAAGIDMLGTGTVLQASIGLVVLNAAVAFAVMLAFLARRRAEWLKLY
ncbi:MAG: hypothetical protein LBE08_01340 [Bifidobacteriaceae bacterium]|jgi:hypothetical protein|nr:hypothetical protein [Bifidobacteriaceae bacterium]